jgi:hypothetical protein
VKPFAENRVSHAQFKYRRSVTIGAHGMPILLLSRLRTFIAWLALCAMCFGAAAPTVSKWLAATARASDLIVICDAHGTELVPASSLQAQAGQGRQQGHHHRGNPGGDPSGDGGDCCPYCTLVHHWPCVPAAAAAFAARAPLLAAHDLATDVPAPASLARRRPYMPQAPPRA